MIIRFGRVAAVAAAGAALGFAVVAGCGDDEPTATGGSAGTGGGGLAAGSGGIGGSGGASPTGGGGARASGGAGGSAGAPSCAVPMHDDDFEDGDYLDTFSQGDNSGGVKVVSSADGAEPFAGDRCLRGNFRIGYTDPITGLSATSRYSGLEIPLGGVQGFQVSVRYRVDDDAQWIMDDGSDTGLGYKFFYLRGTPWNNTLNWVMAQLWGPTHYSFGDNQPNQNTGYSAQTYVDDAHGELGTWHHIEIWAVLNSAVGATDGRFRLRVDGTTYHDLDDVPWQTSTEQTFGNLGGVPHMYGGCCGPKFPWGWQIDDLRVWELPAGCVPF